MRDALRVEPWMMGSRCSSKEDGRFAGSRSKHFSRKRWNRWSRSGGSPGGPSDSAMWFSAAHTVLWWGVGVGEGRRISCG